MGVLLLGGLNISSVHAKLSATECVDLMLEFMDYDEIGRCNEVHDYNMCIDFYSFIEMQSVYFLTEDDIKNFSDDWGYDLSDMCQLCSAGYYFNESTRNCSPCPKGYIRSGANLANGCEKCPEDHTTNGTGQSTCIYEDLVGCPPGQEYTGGKCRNCGAGYYKNWVGNDYCVQCDYGYYTPADKTGQVECTPCPQPTWLKNGPMPYDDTGIGSELDGEVDNPNSWDWYYGDSIMSCYVNPFSEADYWKAGDETGNFVLTDRCWYSED